MATLERQLQTDETIKRRPLSTKEYFDLAELGAFEGERVELIDGEILTMAPIGDSHRGNVTLTARTLITTFLDGFSVTIQSSYKLREGYVPEPDFGVFRGSVRELATQPLPLAELIVEVAYSSLQYDRTVKTLLYGKSSIPEYWIVNLIDHVVEVYRSPNDSGYAELTQYLPGESIVPLCLPTATIKVDDLLV